MNERQIFEAALDIADPVRREVYLSQTCGADTALRARVDALLAAHAAASQFLETPAVQQLNTPPDSSGEDTMQLPPSHAPSADEDDSDTPSGPDISFLSPSTKPGSIGTLGHYEILNVLGQGAFGIVFRAFDEKLHRHVAIKTMSVQMAATSPPRKRFLREARAAAAIRHENVVQVYSVEEQPLPYLVMEFIDGETLQQKQRDHGPLDLPELLHVGRQIAAGLAAAHAQTLIHRDVKPGNILLEKGAEQKVKITDFGLARAADDASLTRSGMISGTPLYMAPEQALGQTLDHRSDLFSLGSVLYELATGRPPFRAPNTVAVLRRVVDDTPRPIQEIIPECPDWLVAIINKLLSKQPDERYQSAKEVTDLIARCQSELQLTGQVTCVPTSHPASGAASAPRVPTTPANSTGEPVYRTPAEAIFAARTAEYSKLSPAELQKVRSRKRRTVLLLSVVFIAVIMSPYLAEQFRKQFNAWLWPPIPTLPATELATGLNFDGKDDYVEIPVDWSYPQFTIEAFVTSPAQSDNGNIITLFGGDATTVELMGLYDDSQADPGQRKSGAQIVGQPGFANVVAPLGVGVRQHRALVFDGTHMHYYVNGIWQGKRRSAARQAMQWKFSRLRIGSSGDDKKFFEGQIDQVRISKVARYSNNFAPVTSVASDDQTLALYDFAQGSGDVLKDISGNGHDGKIIGATWIKASGAASAPRVPATPANSGGSRPPLATRHYASGEWIDVLSLIDPQADKLAVSGMTGKNDWRREDGDLVIARDEKASKLLLPLDSAWSAFECELEFTRRAGRGGLNLNIPSGRGECPVVVDHPSGKGGVSLGGRNNGVVLAEGLQLETGKRATMRIEVRREQDADRIWVALNHTQVGQWSGDRNQISKEANEGFPVGRRMSLWIPEGGHEFVVHRLRVRMLDGETATTLRPVPGILPTDSDHRAAEWVLSIGGTIRIKVNGQERRFGAADELPTGLFQLTGVELNSNPTVSDTLLAHLQDCRNLTVLDLNYTNVSDVGLAYFKECKNFTVLHLAGTQVSDAELARFQDCQNLTHLDLNSTKVSDEGLAHFQNRPNLTNLGLSQTLVSDAGLAHFKSCRNLTGIDLNSTEVSDAGLAALFKSCPNLTVLTLNNTKVGDEGLAHCKDCKNLWVLELAGTQVTDASLAKLTGCPKLGSLIVKNTKVTEAGVKKLSAALPGCKIEWDGGVIEPTASPDRRAAEYVLSMGGQIHIKENGQQRQTTTVDDLPSGAFELTLVRLTGNQKVSDVGLATFQNCRNLTELNLNYTPVTDAGLAHFQDCKNLIILELHGTQVSDAGLDTFRDCHNLSILGLAGTQLSGAGLANFKDCKNLTILDLSATPVGDAGLAHFQDCKNLLSLTLHSTKLSDAGLAHFKDCKVLTHLNLSGTQVSDAGLAQFKECQALTSLEVHGTRVSAAGLAALFENCKNIKVLGLSQTTLTDAGLVHFKECQNLSIVDLDATQLGDAGLEHLADCPKLAVVKVKHTKVTEAGVKKLSAALPGCKIEWDGGVIEPSNPIDYAAERRVAEWAIAAKARFNVEAAGQVIDITDVSQLPSGPFHIHALVITPQTTFTPSDFAQIGQLRGMILLGFDEPLKDGSCLVEVAKVKSLQVLQLQRAQISDDHLSALTRLQNLTELDLVFTPIGDAGMAAIAQLTGLKKLHLGQSRVGDEGLAMLKTLGQLEWMSLGVSVTDQGLGLLANFPKLTAVAGLKSHHLTEVGIGHLQRLPNVTALNVVVATDADLVTMKPLAHLTSLTFNFHQFTASGLEVLGEFPKLADLNLGDRPDFDDSYLIPLAKLGTLRKLILQHVTVTAAGIAQFREQRPEVWLHVNGQEYPAQKESDARP